MGRPITEHRIWSKPIGNPQRQLPTQLRPAPPSAASVAVFAAACAAACSAEHQPRGWLRGRERPLSPTLTPPLLVRLGRARRAVVLAAAGAAAPAVAVVHAFEVSILHLVLSQTCSQLRGRHGGGEGPDGSAAASFAGNKRGTRASAFDFDI
eukprot:365524-Chlamydomonas_euryale.AAC.3